MNDLPLADFDYALPPELIAQAPLEDRAASRLFVLPRHEDFIHATFRDAPRFLREGDLLVLNDARVSARRLLGTKRTGGAIEALLLRESAEGEFEALVRPSRRLPPGTQVLFDDLEATVDEDLNGGRRRVRFTLRDNWREALDAVAYAPLPPYIKSQRRDIDRYQTVYASRDGSAAAPTAGLHFTPDLLAELRQKGIEIATVSLDVGLDTFRPLQTETLAAHQMHGERCSVPEATAEAVARCRGRVIAVGTTAVRTLETFATGRRTLQIGTTESRLFIRPGFCFQIVDGMFTNFHMPRTSMLVMLAAMVGRDRLMAAYAEAVRQRYRFLSFGDAMLIL